MAAREMDSAARYFPEQMTLKALRDASRRCQACPLWKTGTQTVFGEGSVRSRVVLVGEQPGNDEDVIGRPFVGPSGRVLDNALARAGIERSDAYVTNVVKHFKWEGKGKKRLHKKPNAREIGACLPWLEAEIALIRPLVLVCLGATAAQGLFGNDFRVSVRRGEFVESRYAPYALATVHPSSILRLPPQVDRDAEMDRLVDDLRVVARILDRNRKAIGH